MTESAPRVPRHGLLGGSFDPIHVGHLALARAAQTALRLSGLIFMPTGHSWQKKNQRTPGEHRLAMVRAALASADGAAQGWHADAREVQREGPTYTIDTLKSLREEMGPQASIVLLMGSDQLQNFATWHEYERVLEYCHIAATQREQVNLHSFPAPVEALLTEHGREALSENPAGDIVFFRMPAVPVSSTRLREQLARGDSYPELLPDGVGDYINQHRLYRQVA
ncbi:MAG: nicotinate (nicotinamide) nucleotide adenylyltransferase [Burkholderiaceae bacterium]